MHCFPDLLSLCGHLRGTHRELLLEHQRRLNIALEQEASAVTSAPVETDSSGGNTAAAAVIPAVTGTEDSLDAFMAAMGSQLEEDKLASIKRQLADVQTQLARVTRLLRIADPDGWIQPGSAAAERARASAVAAAEDRRVKAVMATAAAAAAKRRKEEQVRMRNAAGGGG